jgi:hypothetical protein
MANHNRQGEAREAYLRRKNKPHKVSGLYSGGGAKPIVLTRKEHLVKLRHRGNGKGQAIVHYAQVVCAGRGKLVWTTPKVQPAAANDVAG